MKSQLRHLVADTRYPTKAYNLPSVCERWVVSEAISLTPIGLRESKERSGETPAERTPDRREINMKLISNSSRGHLMFAAAGALLCGFVTTSSPAVAQAVSASSEANEEVTIRAPYVVRREPAPRVGAPSGFRNPELISLSRVVSYADLDLSRASGIAELQTRVRNTARDVCQELNTRYPRTGGQYVYANTDCVKKATDDGMEAIEQVTAVASR